MKHQLTQQGWDGMFTWSPGVPAPMTMDGDAGGSMTSSFGSGPSFDGFNGWMETGQRPGPTMSPMNGQPTNGMFPGDGTGFDGYGRQNE